MSIVRIIGIDPGLRHTGWGIIEAEGSRLSYVADGAVHSVNEDELAVLLQRALLDGGMVAHYRQRAQACVRESYDWEGVVDRYEQLFMKLAGVPATDWPPPAFTKSPVPVEAATPQATTTNR